MIFNTSKQFARPLRSPTQGLTMRKQRFRVMEKHKAR